MVSLVPSNNLLLLQFGPPILQEGNYDMERSLIVHDTYRAI